MVQKRTDSLTALWTDALGDSIAVAPFGGMESAEAFAEWATEYGGMTGVRYTPLFLGVVTDANGATVWTTEAGAFPVPRGYRPVADLLLEKPTDAAIAAVRRVLSADSRAERILGHIIAFADDIAESRETALRARRARGSHGDSESGRGSRVRDATLG